MKRSVCLPVIFSICAVFLLACSKPVDGNGNIVRKDIVVENFNEIELSGIADIHYRAIPEESTSIVVEGDQNIVDLVDVAISGYKINIKSSKNIRPTRLVIYANSPSLSSFKSTGVGNIELNGAIAGDELKIELTGSGDLHVGNIVYKNLLLDISGASNVYLAGQVDKVSYKINGNANIRALGLETNELECEINGNSKIQVNVIKSLSADIKGMGRIEYIEEPQVINYKYKGLGVIRKL